MNMLGEQIKELRLMGDGQAAKGEFTVATLLREAADTIESLRERLQGGTCEMVTSGTPCEGNTDVACNCCGAYNIGEYYDGYGHRAAPKFCPECGRQVKR